MSNRCIFNLEFRDAIYKNMWSFFNLDMMKTMFPKLETTTKPKISSKFLKHEVKYKHTICFKGDLEEGHYVYVTNNLEPKGTYESKLLTREDDDGCCHGAALIFWLDVPNFLLIENPTTTSQYKHNYKTILDFYIYLIESGLWDKALKKNFFKDVTWQKNTTVETQQSLKILKNYRNSGRFD